MGIEFILGLIADVLGILDFILNVVILSLFRKRQRQRMSLTEDREKLFLELSALLDNIEKDERISVYIRNKLYYYLCCCREYWLVFGFAGNYHVRHCLYLITNGDFSKNQSKICNHIISILRLLKKEMKEEKNESTR